MANKKTKTGSNILSYPKWCYKSFCVVFFYRKNWKHDLTRIGAIILAAGSIIIIGWFGLSKISGGVSENGGPEAGNYAGLSNEQVEEKVKSAQDTTDTGNWKSYQSRWYGVEIKYPGDWAVPKHESGKSNVKWEFRSQFRKAKVNIEDPYSGFDVVIYNLSSVKELFNTDEFPKLKNGKSREDEECKTINGHIIETGDYPSEEIYIPDDNDCYNRDLFFSFIRGNYIYNLVPVMNDGYARLSDPMVDVTDYFSEFFSVVSNFKTVDIVRPRSALVNSPSRTAPMPVSYILDSAKRLICAKKNDHPSDSKRNKKGHMDMECCLDPDEYPNPWCYYDPTKYGKYL